MLHNTGAGSPAFAHNRRVAVMKIVAGLTLVLAALALAPAPSAQAADSKIAVVAAENFYGGVVQQIGGPQVEVVSVMNNPDQDPHLFETSPAVARELAAAQIVIYNGADYDPWMPKLLAAAAHPGRVTIVAADLVNKKPGDNPHIWYDPPTMPAVAKAVEQALSKADPAHAGEFQARLATFLSSLEPLHEKIEAVRKKYGGAAVTASEPVFGYMASALGLKMRNEKFQLSIMNDTEPSASDVAAFERDLKEHKVRIMFFNKQASDKIVQHLVEIAKAAKIPVVGVTETVPPDMTFQQWMLSEITDTEKALAGPNS